VLKRVPEVRKY